MLRFIATILAVSFLVSAAQADSVEDCRQSTDFDRQIIGCTELMRANANNVEALSNRCAAYVRKRDYASAFADCSRAIEVDPKNAIVRNARGVAYMQKGDDDDRAIADFNRAIELNPKYAYPYNNRGNLYRQKGEYDRAIADFNRAIEFNPKEAAHVSNRGGAFLGKGDVDRAFADFSEAVRLNPKYTSAHTGLGRVYARKGELDSAIAAYSEAIRLDTKGPVALSARGAAYEAKGQNERAIADYRAALELQATHADARRASIDARTRLAVLETRNQGQQQKPTDAQKPDGPMGRRVALVIANSNYGSVGLLTNPANDGRAIAAIVGRAIAATLRRLGFAEVIERYDLGHAAMGIALRDFGDRAAGAEWAVVYYAGHGIEVNGAAWLIPVDAKLQRDTHVSDETVPLSRVLEKVESAQKLRLVILDACRNNPFVSRMVRSAGSQRAIGRGLGQIEPEGGVLVAYAAKHGTTAEDGTSTNSPFAEALLAHLEEPGLEINFLFRKVRDQVMSSTGRRQEPYLYGSLPSESLFFKSANAR